MMYLDVDGHIYFGYPPSIIPFPKPVRHIPTGSQTIIPLPTRSLHCLCTPGSWQYHVARLLQRVQDARELLHQDLQEIAEPLATLKAHQLSSEQYAVVLAVEQDYQQANQVIDQVLARMLQHFPTEVATLAQLQDENSSLTSRIPEESLVSLQEEQTVEIVLR